MGGRHRYYRPQTKFAKVMFSHLSASHSVHGGGSPGPHPGGMLRGLAGGVSRPTPRGDVEGSGWGVSRPTPRGEVGGSGQGGSPGPHPWGVPRPTLGGGSPGPHPWGCIPACTEADIPQRLLLRVVHILVECILVLHCYYPDSM